MVEVLPVRFRERWIDDGAPLELADDEGRRMCVVVARLAPLPGAPVAVTVTRGPEREHTVAIQLDLETGTITDELVSPDHPHGARDLAWLRTRLDDPLREALRHRFERIPHGASIHDWTDGERPRVALGTRATYAALLPRAWDLVTTFRGGRYALIDTYVVSREALAKGVALEIVDLAGGQVVGHAEVKLTSTAPGTKRPWRCSGEITEALLAALHADPDAWDALRIRAEDVAQIARLMATWERDVREPARAVDALLRVPLHEDALALGRVMALGARGVPALRAALEGRDRAAALTAAHALAGLADPAGLGVLIEALADPDPVRLLDGEFAAVIDALVDLRDHAFAPVVAALRASSDPRAQDQLLEALLALDITAAHSRALVVELVRADPRRASLLAESSDRDPVVVDAVRELAHVYLARTRADADDHDAFEAAFALARALHVLCGERAMLTALQAMVEEHRARVMAQRTVLATDTPLHRTSTPVAVPSRPGRNDPCWCGSALKYKKCHLEADDAGQRRT